MDAKENKYVGVNEFAKETGFAVFFVRQLVKEGRLVTLKSGRKTYINLQKSIEKLNKDMEA